MSKYITKHLASQCAKSLVEKLVSQISEKKKQISDITREIYLKNLPKEIVPLEDIRNQLEALKS